MSSKLAPGPVLTIVPGSFELRVSLLGDLDCFVDHVKMHTAPLTGSLNNRFDAVLFKKFSIIDESTDFATSFNEAFGVVKNVFVRTNEDNVINDASTDFALSIGEVDEHFCDCLCGLYCLTLSHCETIKAVVVATASEAEEFSNTGTIAKLIIPRFEVELNEVRSFIDEIADFSLADELELSKSFLSKEVVDVNCVLDWTSSFLEVFDDVEHLAESFDFRSCNLFDDAEFF